MNMKKTLLLTLLISATILSACTTPAEESAAVDPTATAVVNESSEQESGAFNTNENDPCKPFSVAGEYLRMPYPNLPEASNDDLSVGPKNAPITIIEYSQLTCPACVSFEPILTALRELMPNDVRIIFRHFPFQPNALLTAQALEAANNQDKFEEFKNFMFDRRLRNPNNPDHAFLKDDDFWGSLNESQIEQWLAENIGEIGVDFDQLKADMYSDEIVQKVAAAYANAQSLGIGATPTLFINGYQWPEQVGRNLETMLIFVRLVMHQENEYSECPPTVIEQGKEYSAVISTTKGDVEVALFEDVAPYAVNSFVFLAEEGWYDDSSFFVTDEYIISGDPSDTTYGGPGYAYLDEISGDLSMENVGQLVINNLQPGINGSSFFINKVGLPDFEGRTIFGEVTKGMDVVNSLDLRENTNSTALDRILSITITEN